jgi:4-hydroxy-2-oxoheptanedioate aldolase
MRRSRVLEKLRAGTPVLVGTPSPYPSPKIVELMGLIGYDCAWIDHEHQDLDDDQIWNMALAARATDMDAMVRVRKGEYHTFFRPLEGGANGIMVPHVLDAAEAARVVANAKFPPEGSRGIDGIEAHADHGLQPFAEYIAQANRETFVALQIEDAAGVENAEAIARVPGVDLLFVGPADLSGSLGVVGQLDHPRVREATERVARAAGEAGIHWGSTTGTAARCERLLEQGATFIAWGAAITGLHAHFRGIRGDFERLAGSSPTPLNAASKTTDDEDEDEDDS